jgi:hypothetical protein
MGDQAFSFDLDAPKLFGNVALLDLNGLLLWPTVTVHTIAGALRFALVCAVVISPAVLMLLVPACTAD